TRTERTTFSSPPGTTWTSPGTGASRSRSGERVAAAGARGEAVVAVARGRRARRRARGGRAGRAEARRARPARRPGLRRPPPPRAAPCPVGARGDGGRGRAEPGTPGSVALAADPLRPRARAAPGPR